MGYRRSPSPGARAYEDFRQKTVEHFDNLDRLAARHCAGRNAAVVEVLCYLNLLRNAGALKDRASVKPVKVDRAGARYQATRGSRALDQQAAHCLPCQVLIGRRDPSQLTHDQRTRLALRDLFGKVTVLPSCFNRADIAAERYREADGMVAAFVKACEAVVHGPRSATAPVRKTYRHTGERFGELYTRDVWPLNRDLVKYAYHRVWQPNALTAFELAVAQKELQAPRLPRAEDFTSHDPRYGVVIDLEALEDQRAKVTPKQEDVNEVIWILEKYIDKHAVEPSKLLDSQMAALEAEFRL